jgi:DNA binding domain, excisionase family
MNVKEVARVEKMLTKKQVAEMLQVSERTIDRMREAGLPYIKVCRQVRFNESDVLKFIRKEK